jgi:hypothetical protein
LNITVVGDSFNIILKWNANITNLTFLHRYYQVTCNISGVTINYRKSFDRDERLFTIT